MMQLQRKRRWKKPRRKETMVKVDADVAEEGEEEDHVNRDVLADEVDEERIVEAVRVLAINVLLQEEQIKRRRILMLMIMKMILSALELNASALKKIDVIAKQELKMHAKSKSNTMIY